MQDQQNQLIAKLKEAQNVLVTVSKNPSVDQLSAAIGLTVALNKLDKHATAVFSGQVPSTIEFLQPEETLEKNTDSLRDFIIALDKSKADKLRYKVEDEVVRIFITPYRTSISEKDLDFSQGDFNVDVVVAIGVPNQQDLDEAIQAHGRILHDATVATLAIEGPQELGTINLIDGSVSSLSEMVASLIQEIDQKLIDAQIATALLTGIVAMTDRFSNDRTSSKTMSVSALLMSAGANQQLIATQLEAPHDETKQQASEEAVDVMLPEPEKEPGTLEINHGESEEPEEVRDEQETPEVPPPAEIHTDSRAPQIHVDEDGRLINKSDEEFPEIGSVHGVSEGQPPKPDEPQSLVTRERMVEPPSLGGALTANTEEEGLDAPAENLTLPSTDMPMLEHDGDDTAAAAEPAQDEVPSVSGAGLPRPQDLFPSAHASADDDDADDTMVDQIDTEKETLAELEAAVDSPHLRAQAEPQSDAGSDVDDARSAVEAALNAASATTTPDPIAALNAQPLGSDLRESAGQTPYTPAPGFGPSPGQLMVDGTPPGGTPADQTLDMPLPTPQPGSPMQNSQFLSNSSAPTSAFPGTLPAQAQDDNLPPPPPVPPPPIIPA